MNVKLLRRIQRVIKKRADQFDMNTWFNKDSTASHCGTTACLAGWALTLAGRKSHQLASPLKIARGLCQGFNENFDSIGVIGGERNYTIAVKGATELGLDYNQAEKLFYINHWPAKFSVGYYRARDKNDNVEKARVTCERIDHFIKTNGTE